VPTNAKVRCNVKGRDGQLQWESDRRPDRGKLPNLIMEPMEDPHPDLTRQLPLDIRDSQPDWGRDVVKGARAALEPQRGKGLKV
jgi:hypothetical protein